jgi:myosin heavy subunit
MWWKNETSEYIPKEGKCYPKEEVFNALSENASTSNLRIEALEQNQNITKAEIQSFVMKYTQQLQNHESILNGLAAKNRELSENASSNKELINTLTQKQNRFSQNIENFVQKMQNTIDSLQSGLKELACENKNLKEEIAALKSQMNALQTSKSFDSSNTQKMNTRQSVGSSSSDQIVATFNRWAKNPGALLPGQFRYANGELKLREKQEIKSCYDGNALWIVNTSGSTKYLFPNPNSIDQIAGDIDVLYKVTGTRNARGQNKVDIQEACVIKDDGWIEYKGTLSLI